MEKITSISPEWQNWLLENLGRGCTPQSLIDVMVEKNFDPMFASAIVFHFSSSNNQARPSVAAKPGAQSIKEKKPLAAVISTKPRACCPATSSTPTTAPSMWCNAWPSRWWRFF